MSERRHVKGPTRWQLALSLPSLLRDPLAVFLRWQREYGDTVTVPVRRPPTLHVSDPEDIRHILTINHLNYRKTGALIIGRRLMGQGLLASGEPLHEQQRRIAQPHFLKPSVQSFASMMESVTEHRIEGWQEGDVIDIFPEMARITIAMIGRAYFGTDLSAQADQLYRDFGICQRFMQKLINLPETYPTPGNLRYKKAVERIEAVVLEILRERRGRPDREPGDLLGTFLTARGDNGRPLPEKQIRDEMVNILLAGHETTAIALAWTWYFLSRSPEVEQRFHREIDAIGGTAAVDATEGGRLNYTEMVLNESMRIMPPVWILGRLAMRDDMLASGLFIQKGTEVLMMPYLAHRNKRHFPEPEMFNPERFTVHRRAGTAPFVYYPFGGGPRGCIGEAFARLEATIILTTIARRFSLKLVPGHPVVPEPLVTLRPKSGILMEIRGRNEHVTRGGGRMKAVGSVA